MRQSSIPFAIGMLEAPFTSSAPSDTNHFALLFRPHSLSSVDSGTPVHSEQLVMPCVSCTVFCRPSCRLPAHSMKCNLVTDGKRFNSRSEEHTSELQSHVNLVCRLLLEKKNY